MSTEQTPVGMSLMGKSSACRDGDKRKSFETPKLVAEDACDMMDGFPAIASNGNGQKSDADFLAFVDGTCKATANAADEVTIMKSIGDVPAVDMAIEKSRENPPDKEKGRFVTPKDFELLKVIGMGAFGKVLQVRNKRSKEVLAMKVISKRLLKRRMSYIENIQAERDILTKIKSPFVVTMHCSFQTKEKLFIIMDFLAGGELFLRLGREGIFREKTAAFYLGEIILALDHLHTRGILHRDLKPENILLGIDGHVCLTDFGLAKDFSEDGGFRNDDDESRAKTVCGTQEYMAPEMIARRGYGRAADFWSLGCIAYEMLRGEPPFTSKKGSKDLFTKIMSEKVKMPEGSTAAACVLLRGLLNRNASARFGAAKSTMFAVGGIAGLKQQEFFSCLSWEKLERKETDPPETLPVDNDEDLRHFHDEFVQMPLPKSVKEMSEKDFLPSRIKSDAFRGFSFIHDDFQLPDRQERELAHYWNTLDDDGESESDAASSKCGDELKSQPEKKRPPRKRNKKPAIDVPLSLVHKAVPASSFDNSLVPCEDGTRDSVTIVVNNTTEATKDGTKQYHMPQPLDATNEITVSLIASNPHPVKASKLGQINEEIWQSVGSGPVVVKKSAKQLTTPGTQSNQQKVIVGGLQKAPQKGQQLLAPTIKPAHVPSQSKPFPGSWAQKKQEVKCTIGPTQPSHTQIFQQEARRGHEQQLEPAPLTSPLFRDNCCTSTPINPQTPSGDWRRHALARKSPATSAKQARQFSGGSELRDWPTLNGDFPLVQGGAPTNGLKTAAPPIATAKGVWASRIV